MDIKQLRHFTAVVDAGTMSAAAERLYITQPALTRSIKNLEGLLGAMLLERRSKGVVPTEAGHRLYRHAQFILNETERAKYDVAATAAGEQGQLSIGIGSMFAGPLAAEVLDVLSDRFPKLFLTVKEALINELLQDLAEAKLDAALSFQPPIVTDDRVSFEAIGTVTSYFVVSPDHPLAGRDTVEIAELKDQRFAFNKIVPMSSPIIEAFAKDGLSARKPVIEANSINLLKALALRGTYISFLPDQFIKAELAEGTLVPLPIEGTPTVRPVGVFTTAGESAHPAVKHFCDVVREIAGVSLG